MRQLARALGLGGLLLLAGCQVPPPEAFLAGAEEAVGEPAGNNARGEPCTVAALPRPTLEQPVARASAVFCGGWSQPAARVYQLAGGSTEPAALERLASAGLWRQGLEERLACSGRQPTRLAGGAPAVLLDCVRRRGGWPHVALVVAGREGPVLVDGLAAALPVVERLLAGTGAASTEGGRSAAMEIAVARLAAEAYGAADASRFEQLLALGRDLNQAEKFAAAEDAYRAALAIQQRVVGADSPNSAGTLMALALNLSNQGRDAAPLFAAAAAQAPRAANPLLPARLPHYLALDQLNRGEVAAALPLLDRAEAAYRRIAPASAAVEGGEAGAALLLDSTTQSAVLGLAEVRRYRGVVLGHLGRHAEAEAALRDARQLLRNAGLESGLLVGRNLRSRGGARAEDDPVPAARFMAASAARFALAQPGERPEAMTLFLAGGRRLAAGERGLALDLFRSGEAILRRHHLGLPAELVVPYLDALAAEAADRPADAAQIQADMFEVAQLARRESTGRLVAQAAARLAAAGGSAQVAAAVRRLQEADLALRGLMAQRDQGLASTLALDQRIAAAETARGEAEAEVAAAAPGYRQLLLAVADDSAVAAVLAPREAFVSMLLGPDHGYAFAIRHDGRVQAHRIGLTERGAAKLVDRIRAGTETTAEGLPRFDLTAAGLLYQSVLAPLAAALEGADTLLVMPDGPLLSIPFSLLVAGPREGQPLSAQPWLVRRFAIQHVPSAETLVTTRNAAGGAASTAPLAYAGFGDPVMPDRAQLRRAFPATACADDAELAGALPALPGSRVEVEAAAQLSGARPDAVRLGAAFTASALRAQRLEQYRVLHIATHALMSSELRCLREPSLMVSPPPGAPDASAAFVPASALLELKLDADLVILSACNTGTTPGGSALGGEGLSALARASFFAGARGVLATHWVLNDRAASRMVADLLERQGAEGQSSAAALRRAQLDLLDQAGNRLPEVWAHPYYWAPFALLGDGKRASRS